MKFKTEKRKMEGAIGICQVLMHFLFTGLTSKYVSIIIADSKEGEKETLQLISYIESFNKRINNREIFDFNKINTFIEDTNNLAVEVFAVYEPVTDINFYFRSIEKNQASNDARIGIHILISLLIREICVNGLLTQDLEEYFLVNT